MTFITDITKADLLAMIDERLKMFAPPAQHAGYCRLAEKTLSPARLCRFHKAKRLKEPSPVRARGVIKKKDD